jgi:arginyl-tRNA synthetase
VTSRTVGDPGLAANGRGFRAYTSHEAETGSEAISRLNALDRAARLSFDGDPEFADRARRRVVALQASDPETLSRWAGIVAESKVYFNAVDERLGVMLTDEDSVGESFYNPLPLADLSRRAAEVGIGAVKYADLSAGRTRDYIFDLGRMVSLHGNTGVYLQYAHARIASILRKLPAGAPAPISAAVPLEPAERRLALLLDGLDEVLGAVRQNYEPHRLCSYLYSLAQAFTDFYEACPVLKAPTEELAGNHVALCRLTGSTLRLGLELLGIAAPDRL